MPVTGSSATITAFVMYGPRSVSKWRIIGSRARSTASPSITSSSTGPLDTIHRRDRRVGALLIGVEKPARVDIEQTSDTLAGGKEIGDERRIDAVDLFADEHRMLPARGEFVRRPR